MHAFGREILQADFAELDWIRSRKPCFDISVTRSIPHIPISNKDTPKNG